MREVGEIIRLDHGKYLVRLNPHGGCDKCGLNGFCHATGTGSRELHLPAGGGDHKPGERVEIETAPGGVLTAAFLVFILPLVLSIVAYVVVSNRTSGEGYPIIAFLVTFILAEISIMGIDRVFGKKPVFQPRIMKRLGTDSK